MPNILKLIKGALKKQKPIGRFQPIGWLNTKIIKHEEDRSPKKRNIGQFKINYIKPYELLHTYEDLFVNELYNFNTGEHKPVIIDCGSNIGLSILYFKAIYPHAIVLGFEPDPVNHGVLKMNLSDNQLKDVVISQEAVWIHDQGISFSGAGTEASRIGEGNSDSEIKVPTIRLKELIKKYPRIDFLKMDIEGAEHPVIMDCREDLHVVQNLFLEYHGKSNETDKLNELLQVVKENGFEVYIKNAADLMKQPFVEKHTPYAFDVQLNIFCYKP